MTLLDAKEILELVHSKWILSPYLKPRTYAITNGNAETGDLTGWTGEDNTVVTSYKHSGTYSFKLGQHGNVCNPTYGYLEQDIETLKGFPVPVTDLGSLGVWVRAADGLEGSSGRIKITYSDDTETIISVPEPTYQQWLYVNISSYLTVTKSISKIRFYKTGTYGYDYVDDITQSGDIALVLDEYNPNDPLYQIVFINKPERTLFVAPNVIKHEQDIHIEVHVKYIRYEPTEITNKRATFLLMKGELSRIFNTYRFDEVGSTINVSAWVDHKLPHGLGLDKEPLELVTRLTLQIFYYESTDGSNIGVRVSKVTILGVDLLGLIDAHWVDTNPWVHLQVPKGPLLEQHLLGPHIDGEITTHDYASLYARLYQTPIVGGGIQYPILVGGAKIKFSTIPETPQFIIKMVDDEGDIHTYNFYDVRIKQVELVKTNTSGQNEAAWKILFMADYVYYVAPS